MAKIGEKFSIYIKINFPAASSRVLAADYESYAPRSGALTQRE